MTEPEVAEPEAIVPAAAEPAAEERVGGLSRRGLLGLLGAGAGGLVLGGAGGAAIGAAVANANTAAAANAVHPFFGTHQAGITTPVQDHLHFAAFDMADDATRDDLISLLKDWSYAASRMTQGLDVSATGAVGGSPDAPPDDTGEALGLPASALSLTFGFGPDLFQKDGADRFGIASRRPDGLESLPRFVGDALDAAQSGGELCVQACADDPQVAVHAIRNLSRIAFGRAQIRWSKLGFGRTSKTSSEQATPRNLFGYKDGTANILGDDTAALKEHVWADGPSWLSGGSYLVVRTIRQKIEPWDRQQLVEQDRIIGRSKGEGAPLSGGTEFTEPDFSKKDASGQPAIDMHSHVRLAHPEVNGGIRLMRRGYNFVEGNDALGSLNAGLFFLSYQKDPARFVTVQRSLRSDLLNEYIQHTGSAVFAIPPGAKQGSYIGEALFA